MDARTALALGAAAMLCGACGRLGFSPGGSDGAVDSDATGDAADGATLDFVQFPMDDVPAGTVAAVPSTYGVPCAPCPAAVASGRHGGAYAFLDGPVVRIPHPEWIGPSHPFAVSFWFRTMDTNFRPMVTKPLDDTASAWNVLSLWLGTGTDLAWETYFTPTLQTTTIDATVAFTDGAWHHVVASYDGVSVRTLYYDGAVVGTSTLAFDDSTNDLLFGGDIDAGTTLPYTGFLDDLRFYLHALSLADVTQLFTAP